MFGDVLIRVRYQLGERLPFTLFDHQSRLADPAYRNPAGKGRLDVANENTERRIEEIDLIASFKVHSSLPSQASS